MYKFGPYYFINKQEIVINNKIQKFKKKVGEIFE